jgi:hypothetical protein
MSVALVVAKIDRVGSQAALIREGLTTKKEQI